MTYITRFNLADTAADRWREQYEGGPLWDDLRRGVWGRLQALNDPDPCEVDAVIGNGSWTRITCDECKESVSEAVEMGSHSDDEYGPCRYCKDCLRKAHWL